MKQVFIAKMNHETDVLYWYCIMNGIDFSNVWSEVIGNEKNVKN